MVISRAGAEYILKVNEPIQSASDLPVIEEHQLTNYYNINPRLAWQGPLERLIV